MDLTKLLEAIKTDYLRTNSPQRMVDEFNSKLRFEEGNKYIKIITGGSVWGFVVNVTNDKQFAYGDILKAAGWAAPARNKARGNVVSGDLACVQWTSPVYLK